MLVNSSLASKESRSKLEQRLKNLKWACCQQGLAAQLAFNILLAHGILQFAMLIALRCALHRYLNQDIRRWKLLGWENNSLHVNISCARSYMSTRTKSGARTRCNPTKHGSCVRTVPHTFACTKCVDAACNDPSAGSPTETLLRLLLPLSGLVY